MESSHDLIGSFLRLYDGPLQLPSPVESTGTLTIGMLDSLEEVISYDFAIAVFPQFISQGMGVFIKGKVPQSDSVIGAAISVLVGHLDRMQIRPHLESERLIQELHRQCSVSTDLVFPNLSHCLQPVVGHGGIFGLVGLFRLAGVTFDEIDRLNFATAVGGLAIDLDLERSGQLSRDVLNRAEEELQRLRVLETISMRINTTLDPQKIAEFVSTSALELIPHLDVGSVWCLNQSERQMELLAEKGYPQGFFHKKSSVSLDENWAITKVIGTGMPEFMEDLNKTENFEKGKAVARRTGHLSWACLPLRSNRGILGALFIASNKPRRWDLPERSFLEAVASLVAQALDNSFLYQQAETQRKWLQLILDQMPEAVLITEAAEGRIVMVNKAAEEMIGFPIKIGYRMLKGGGMESIRRINGEAFSASELPVMRSLLTGETCLGVEMIIRRPDGTETIALANSSALRDTEGRIVGSVVVTSDITKIKEVEKLKDEFFSVASHELRTPLTSIRGFTQSMLRRLEKRLETFGEADSPEHEIERKQMRIILGQVDKITALVEDLMDATRLQGDSFLIEFERVNLAALAISLSEKLQLTTDKHKITMSIKRDSEGDDNRDGEYDLLGDERLLESVLTNLLHNAIKFSPHGGEVNLSLQREKEQILVCISDQGIGIPSHQTEEIFKPFSQGSNVTVRQFGGFGLGLHLSKEIVERHSGRIWVERKADAGSKICFTLPVNLSEKVGRV